jgi:hypothetical protein
MSGWGLLTVIECAYYINKGILCPRNTDVYHVSEDILNSFDAQFKIYLSVNFTDFKIKEDISLYSLSHI